MKKKVITIIFLWALVLSQLMWTIPVRAGGTATFGVSGNQKVTVGEEFNVSVSINNISSDAGGVVGASGNLSFDRSYLQYISSTGITSPYKFQINSENNYRFNGLDTSLSNPIKTNTTVVTFKFKALKEGKTTVSVINSMMSDTDSKLTVTNGSKEITIEKKSGGSDTPTPQSSDATLKGLSVSGYSLSPSFSPSVENYNLTVPHNATSVIINASKNNDKANVRVSGNTDLKVGNNKVTIKVTAENGTTKEYVINVKREDTPSTNSSLSSDATLKSLSVSGYTLTPKFSKNVTSYTIKVANNITGLKVDATPNHSKATVTVKGNSNWVEGVNTISIKVTAENGTTKTYSVNAIRASKKTSTDGDNPKQTSKSDATLKSLVINSAHTIDKKFTKDEHSYSVTVPYEVEKLDLSYVANNSKAKIKVSGNESLKIGETNNVIITVTAEDGTQEYYILNVTRSSETSGTSVEKILVNGKDIYEPGKDKFTVNVDSKTDKLDLNVQLKDKDSKVEIIGNENLKAGHNSVLVKVTDKNGMTKYYEIDAYKEEAQGMVSSDGTILGLKPYIWGTLLGILGFFFLLFLIIFALFRRKKDDSEEKTAKVEPTPVIDFKPEFNFGSRNGTDDDHIEPGGVLNQYSGAIPPKEEVKKIVEANYEEASIEPPYDMYDATVTKDELIDAIHEAAQTKDTAKLKMLLDQDALNKRKKALKRKEELNKEVEEDD